VGKNSIELALKIFLSKYFFDHAGTFVQAIALGNGCWFETSV
jgi:hypothetical protein